MKKEELKGKKVGVLGLGVEGFVSAAYLTKLGATVTVLELKEEKEMQPETLQNLRELGVTFHLGSDYKAGLTNFEIIVRSPGVKLTQEERVQLQEHNIVITSQTQLFFDLSPAKIIGVTGTKGKGTTATLIYEMLKKAGKDVYLGGNIGLPPLSFVDRLTKESLVVLELSSFQLMDLGDSPASSTAMAGKPHIAVMLMIVPEHLDYHTDVYEYIDAKRNILRFQKADDYAIVNRDYVATNESDVHTEGHVYYVSREREHDEGSFIQENALWVRKQGKIQKVIDIEDIRLPGKHNIENVLSAIMAASIVGVSREDMVSAIQSFSGLEHRLELAREVRGVKYYDDSFSTTPETAIAAIEAFSEPKILILGGSGKESDFTELGKVISEAKHIKAIIGIGDEWPRIREAIDSYSSSPHQDDFIGDNSEINREVEKNEEDTSEEESSQRAPLARTIPPILIEGAKDMYTVVQAAAKLAQAGDIVLLSPGCASFGMFKNYKERGEQFKEEVLRLIN